MLPADDGWCVPTWDTAVSALVMGRVAGAWLATPALSRSLDNDRSEPATLDSAVTPDPHTAAGTWGSESPGAVSKFPSST